MPYFASTVITTSPTNSERGQRVRERGKEKERIKRLETEISVFDEMREMVPVEKVEAGRGACFCRECSCRELGGSW